ncbi:MAG: SAM-dependent methyltransferase [Pirellulaceae bacterium]|nr:MAG: SAM-dependent methyltransferase [Pirellulaceae bacterium]
MDSRTSESSREQDSLEHNRRAWDSMAHSFHILTQPVRPQELQNPLRTVDPVRWLGDSIRGWNVLCLAAGGGRHGPLYAAAGARVTVVDLSPAMLERDRQVAAELRLSLQTIETSMDDLRMLGDATFDLVIHPVSTCYLPSLERLFPEVARVTRPGGLYISQHKQPTNLQASLESHLGQYVIEHSYYDPRPVPPAKQPSKLREPGTREYVHRWETLLGGICRAGFTIEDVTEPFHARADAPIGSFHHRCHYIPPYIRIKARRQPTGASDMRDHCRKGILEP